MTLPQLKLLRSKSKMLAWKKIRRGPRIANPTNIGVRVTLRKLRRLARENT